MGVVVVVVWVYMDLEIARGLNVTGGVCGPAGSVWNGKYYLHRHA